jgi:class 3 adenylate cyclase
MQQSLRGPKALMSACGGSKDTSQRSVAIYDPLAAIVAADVVGYFRLMGRDESRTLARLADISLQIVAA